MTTKLDEKTILIRTIDSLNENDIQKLTIFLSGWEVGRLNQELKEEQELAKTGT